MIRGPKQKKKKSRQLYLKHISQKWLFIEIISAYKDKWQLECKGFTASAIPNFSWNNAGSIKHILYQFVWDQISENKNLHWPSIQSDAAIRSGVYASFASFMKFGGSSWLEAPQTWIKEN